MGYGVLGFFLGFVSAFVVIAFAIKHSNSSDRDIEE